MRLLISASVIFSSIGVVLVAANLVCGDEALQNELGELDRLRKGSKTPFAEVEARARQLLKDYPAAEDQGQIYYQLAHTYAQGGMFVKETAERAVQYSKKALDYPLDPVRRLRSYIYWGSGLRVADRTQPFARRRKAAAAVYLSALKEAQNYDIPDEPPLGVPEIAFDPTMLAPDRAEKYQRQQEEARAANERAKVGRELWHCRKGLVDQVLELYSRRPLAASELRELATATLQNRALVEGLMSALDKKGALRDDPQ